jgi:hypothetical protein
MGSELDFKVGVLEAAVDEVLELVNILNALGQVERAHQLIQEVHRLTDRLTQLLEEDQ